MKVLFTPSGRSQFLAAIAYIYRDNPTAAIAFRNKAEKVLSRLRKFPPSGRTLPEFPDLPFREIIVNPYRFFYRVREKPSVLWPYGIALKSQKGQARDRPAESFDQEEEQAQRSQVSDFNKFE